jgi:hypothetical protein
MKSLTFAGKAADADADALNFLRKQPEMCRPVELASIYLFGHQTIDEFKF